MPMPLPPVVCLSVTSASAGSARPRPRTIAINTCFIDPPPDGELRKLYSACVWTLWSPYALLVDVERALEVIVGPPLIRSLMRIERDHRSSPRQHTMCFTEEHALVGKVMVGVDARQPVRT